MRPDAFEYNNYRLYLRAYLAWMAETDRKYSLRWLAKKVGFASPSLLSMMMSGQRSIAKDKLLLVCEAFKLTQTETDYIRLIFDLENADSQNERARIANEICLKFKGGLFKNPEADEWEIYSAWYLPVIRELVALSTFRADPFWIATHVGISPIEAEAALTTLLRIGLVRTDGKTFSRSEPSFQPKSPPPTTQIENFTVSMHSEGLLAVKLPREARYLDTLTVACSKYTFTKIKEVLARVIVEVDMLAESDSEREELAQLNIQFFSLIENAKNRRKLAAKIPSNLTTREADQ